jgi:hypothetical protein
METENNQLVASGFTFQPIIVRPEFNIVGKRFGRLVVLRAARRMKSGKVLWYCECNCGGSTITMTSNLTSGHTQSCGCFMREQTSRARKTHGASGSVEHRTWKHIKMRCYNPKDISYKNYGGRGIIMCERWRHSAENFIADMGPKPSPKHSIDRINNDGNYEPSNCRWATRKQQNNNKRQKTKAATL